MALRRLRQAIHNFGGWLSKRREQKEFMKLPVEERKARLMADERARTQFAAREREVKLREAEGEVPAIKKDPRDRGRKLEE